ncbi:histidinol-phosphatase HisJ [Paenibacillus harenae]|uniref:Histidinol-phosphatase n=1 Tax=Paenibacillus harenae TaxID=306543 RepID=A0ABT9U0I8_PAEHA|nr:histidinol-phosphatase HisJ [Paenibacillus harenae]MDQ0112767.1 histidinol-phosphatase (PHP family) [Paenibacillus harenae]
MKWDGHTHSHFCRHGSDIDLKHYLQKAEALGFSRYTVSEHPPLPEGWLKDTSLMQSLAMNAEELPAYIACVERLKSEFDGRLEVTIGLELDYLYGDETFTERIVSDWHGKLDDVILSVHYLPGRRGMRCIDYTPADFRQGLLAYYGTMEKVVNEYYDHVELAIDSAAGWPVRTRLGHVNLIEKFRLLLPGIDARQSEERLRNMIPKLAAAGIGIDVNTAGMRKSTCLKPYAPEWFVRECLSRGIACVFGSDAHRPEDIGSGWDWYAATIAEKE